MGGTGEVVADREPFRQGYPEAHKIADAAMTPRRNVPPKTGCIYCGKVFTAVNARLQTAIIN
jgi:hypothetical protein